VGNSASSSSVLHFGEFALDPESGELWKNGIRIKLPPQPFKILALLVSRAGQVVTPDEIQQQVWGSETNVDFENGLNFCIKRIRAALADDAESPRYIETLPKIGYRLIAPVEVLDPVPAPSRSRVGLYLTSAALTVALVAGTVVGLNLGGVRDRLLGRPIAGEISSIAVLPLQNLSGDPEQDYFAEGMTDALITELGQISALRVISRQSVMRFKASDKSLSEIARELNVAAVVEGSVVHDGDRIRLTAQLVQAQPERHLWARTYDRDLRAVLALQGELARTIASEIRTTLLPHEQARLVRVRTVHPQAYDYYLKGLSFWSKRTTQDTETAIENYQKAISIDPEFAPAYAYLSVASFRLGRYSQAEQAARKAVVLDDQLAEAYVALSVTDREGDPDAYLRKAVELNPNSVFAHHWRAMRLIEIGRHAEAIEELKRAQALDPLSPIINTALAGAYQEAGQKEKAFQQNQLTLEMAPEFATAHSQLAALYEEEGKFDQALPEYERAVELGCYPIECLGELGYAYARAGNRPAALKVIKNLEALWPSSGFAANRIAMVYAGLGDHGRALQWLDKSFEASRNPAEFVDLDKRRFATLRSDPRYLNRLRSLSLHPN